MCKNDDMRERAQPQVRAEAASCLAQFGGDDKAIAQEENRR